MPRGFNYVSVLKAEDGKIHGIFFLASDARNTLRQSWSGSKKKIEWDSTCINCEGSGKIYHAKGWCNCPDCTGTGKNTDSVRATAPDGSCWIIESHPIQNKPNHL